MKRFSNCEYLISSSRLRCTSRPTFLFDSCIPFMVPLASLCPGCIIWSRLTEDHSNDGRLSQPKYRVSGENLSLSLAMNCLDKLSINILFPPQKTTAALVCATKHQKRRWRSGTAPMRNSCPATASASAFLACAYRSLPSIPRCSARTVHGWFTLIHFLLGVGGHRLSPLLSVILLLPQSNIAHHQQLTMY